MSQRRRVLIRALVLVFAVAAMILFATSPAFAAPTINWLHATNPVAYELKSLQSTHFYANVDTGGVWAELKVKTPKGDVRIYSGPIYTANENFWFPLWKGLGPDGKRLPSSVYTYVLTISKGGYYATTSGRISVSRIVFSRSGTSTNGYINTFTGYMIPTSANFYASLDETKGTYDEFWLWIVSPPLENLNVFAEPVSPYQHRTPVAYVRGAEAELIGRGVRTFKAQSIPAPDRDYYSPCGVSYKITVIQ